MSLGVLHCRDAGAPAAWSCWDAVGTGPGLLSQPRAQPHAGLPHQHSPALWGLTACREQLFSSPPCQCALGCFQNPLGTTELSPQPPSHCPGQQTGARSCQARAQLQPSAWLTRRAAGCFQSHRQGHWATPRSPALTWDGLVRTRVMLRAGQGPCGLKLTWPIKALLHRSALAAGPVGLEARGQGWCVSAAGGDSAAVSGCARALWHQLLSHGAAWGRAQLSPHCWAKAVATPPATHHHGAILQPPAPGATPSRPCWWQCQALGWHRTRCAVP